MYFRTLDGVLQKNIFRTVLAMLEISYFGNEDEVLDKKGNTGWRYSPEEQAAAVPILRTLRAESGTERGTAEGVGLQLGCGVGSVVQRL